MMQPPTKGRGAVSNLTGRFEANQRESFDDGWHLAGDEDDLPPVKTILTADASRTILARNDSPDIPFDRSINPYRGCEHGCIYCFARPTHAYLGLSPGQDFETRIFHKPHAATLLEQELRKPGYRPAPIALGANTDPYQPAERHLRITRSVLQVLHDFSHPVGLITKSALITRDIDLLAPLAKRGLVLACLSITTLDRDLARAMEPRASTPARRLQAIRDLTAAGIPTAVLASPMIPGLNDHELEAILQAAAEAGATGANTILLRLPLEIGPLFEEWLATHFPDRRAHVLSLMRQCRDGALYKAEFGQRMRGTGPYAALLRQRFQLATKKLGLRQRGWGLDCSQFAPPARAGDQLAFSF